MAKRLVIDLEACAACEACTVACGYFHRPPGAAPGLDGLRERATFAVVCRRCVEAACVAACPCEALERRADGTVHRHLLRCIACRLCAQACPFGTILPGWLGFYATPCDICRERAAEAPPCTWGCPREAVAWREADPSEENLQVIDEHLAVIATRWERANV